MDKGNPLYNEYDSTRLNGSPGVDEEREPGWSPYQKDYARLLHSPSLRRLQGKTQLFPSAESDFFRNRLTHSLEVAQIAAGIARRLNKIELPRWKRKAQIDVDLVQFAALAHDLGHPPFGHNGEHALDQLMRPYGGYEGNAQTLRILSSTEKKLIRHNDQYSSNFGLNLTYRALASVLKYDNKIPPVRQRAQKPEKGYYASDEALVTNLKNRIAPSLNGRKFKTIECSIMDIADDIAYSTYDLEDSLHAGFVTPLRIVSALRSTTVLSTVTTKINKALRNSSHAKLEANEIVKRAAELFNLTSEIIEGTTFAKGHPINSSISNHENISDTQKEAINLLTRLIPHDDDQKISNNPLMRTRFTSDRVGQLINSIELIPDIEFPQLSKVTLKREALIEVELLKHLNYELNILSPRLAVLEHRGQKIVEQIFRAIIESDGNLLPEDWRDDYTSVKKDGIEKVYRVVCDYVASLTDGHAAELHSRLFSDGQSVFKPL